MKFRVLIEGAGKTAAGMEVPPEVVAALGESKRPPVRVTINGYTYRSTVAVLGGRFMVGVSNEVRVTINGYTYRSTVAVLGGRFMVGVSNEVRAASGVAAGDTVEVEMELDTAPREVTVPPELASELARDKAAQKAFEALSYSKKRLIVDPVANAKTAETRDRNIAKALSSLRS